MSFHKVVLAFNSLLTQHKLLEALDFYDSEIIAADNLHQPVAGLAALKEKTADFIENTTIEAMEVVSLLSEENLSVTNWWVAYTHKKFGRVAGHRFSVQRWKDNKIIQENHFYVE